MSLDEEKIKRFNELLDVYEKYKDAANFKGFYDETESFRNNPDLLNNRGKYILFYNTGLHYTQDLKDHLGAIEFFKKALNCLNIEAHQGMIAEIKRSIGTAYWELGEEYFKDATYAFKESYLLATYSTFKGFDYVFSYRTINKYFLQDIINNEITVVSPTLFNDPVDSPFLSFIRDTGNKAQEAAASYFKIRSFVSNVSVKGTNEPKGNTSIEEYKNFLMWSHYADSHKGVCVKYKLLGEFSNGNLEYQIATHPVDVKYENSFKHKERLKLDLTDAFATKNKCWEYENEVRLIHYDPNCNNTVKALPLGENGYIEAVYFGLRCPQKDMDTIRGILKEEVAYFKMKEDEEDIFKLVEVPQNDKAKAMLEAASKVEVES